MSAGQPPLRVFVVGATGYIGRHVVRELVRRHHRVVCFVRERAGVGGRETPAEIARRLEGAEIRVGDVTDAASIAGDGLRGERFDAVVSCLASRTGHPDDARRIDEIANTQVLAAAKEAGASHFVLLSAICVQRPLLAFQRSKLAFEDTLVASGMPYSIVRPTAFFKSLSGQIEGVKRGKPFLVFGDGALTACKPISEADLARFLADCLDDPAKRNAVLPIGGPGPAITPKQQGAILFDLLGRPARYRSVPIWLMDGIIAALRVGGLVFPSLAAKAEFARIGRFYATESMLALNPATGIYDADRTPSYGEDTLRDFYARALHEGLAGQELGDHALFERSDSEPSA